LPSRFSARRSAGLQACSHGGREGPHYINALAGVDYVHCAAGGRAAAMWMIKRVVADHWDEQRALTEANVLGLNDRLRPFALNYIHTHAGKRSAVPSSVQGCRLSGELLTAFT
jgi:hypothetical protein